MTTELIDTHCHLAILDDRGVLDDALASCVESGVTQIISVGLNADDSDVNRSIAERYPGIWFSVGWHPHEAAAPDAAQLENLNQLLRHPRAVAVGEIGIDLYFRPGYHETNLAIQQRGLHAMFELAETHNKPVILHDRDAHSEILEVMRAHPRVRGVMHCFSGNAAFAADCIALGYLVSFSGIVTFPRSDDIQGAAVKVADADFTVETDAPFLAPVPHRGRTNLPGYVSATAAAVARLRGASEDAVRDLATANARRLFGLAADDLLTTGR